MTPGGSARFTVTARSPREARVVRLSRRTISIGAVVLGSATLIGVGPLLLAVAGLVDVVRRSRWAAVRLLVVVGAFLALELAGVVASFWLWLRGPRAADFLEKNFRLQCWWAGRLFDVGRALMGMRVACEGLAQARPGPYVLLVRHVSMGDALLPAAFVSRELGVHLRTVLKRELVWDPCLDIVGHRLPNAFVRRASSDPAREIELVRGLAAELGPTEGLLLFPEGTRFSADRRARALARLEAEGPADLSRVARELEHVLPPRLGGVLGALDAAPTADVVFLAHAGLEGARRLGDLWRGALVGGTLRLVFWRVPRSEVPASAEERARWLFDQWRRVDAIAAGRDGAEGRGD